MRPLGRNQEGVLNALRRNHYWHAGCGWVWSNDSGTVRILESLWRRGGLVYKDEAHTISLPGRPLMRMPVIYRPVKVD